MNETLSIEWVADSDAGFIPGRARILDQTLLPMDLTFLEARNVADVWHAIKTLQVRGAPAIGVAAGMGVVLAAQRALEDGLDIAVAVKEAALYLATSRPTAVNLFWALDRMRGVAEREKDLSQRDLCERLAIEAQAIRDEDVAMCRAIGEHGAALLEDESTVLTHCNAGSLATSAWGTALSPIYVAKEQGKRVHVYADETRPLLQGARLTAWELQRAGVNVTLICDNVAAQVMKEGLIDAVFVGADRIAANGDAANKIGTYGVAVLAHEHGIPFYVLAPGSTIDFATSCGDRIPIEERAAEEVTEGFGRRTAPEGIRVYAPAFDVTPAHLITGIITERGIARHGDLRASLARMFDFEGERH